MKSKTLLTIALCFTTVFAFSQIKGLKQQIKSEASSSAEANIDTDRAQYFEGRPTSPGPDVESFKENIPAKKESFSDKLARFKTEGFKVAVVLYSGSVKTIPIPTSSTTTLTTQKSLEGSIPSMRSDFVEMAEKLTSALNSAFNTDVFELVDMTKIPYRKVNAGKVDDWEVTKYRLVMTYIIQPEYDYNFSMNKYNGDFMVNMNLVGTEFVNEKKGVKMKYPLRSGNLGYFKKAYSSEDDPGISTVAELNALVTPPSGEVLVAELQKQQDENLPKIIEKLKKK